LTISSATRKAGPYTGNGSTTSFAFSFKVFTTADLLVVRTNLSAVESTLTLGTDYTVTLNSNQNSNPGGSVILASALTTNFLLTLASKVGYLQPTDLTNQGGFYPSVINDSLDRVTILTQQLSEQLDRSVKVDISSSTTPATYIASIIAGAASATTAATNAATSATSAASSATSATSSATSASTSASTATTQASAASTSATNAATSASTATTQAALATTNGAAQVTLATAQVALATTQATNAATSASTASTQASNASTNATNAATSATNAASSASSASTSASTATTQATAASTSATNAASSASAAASSATAAAAAAASGLYRQVLDKSANYTVTSSDGGTLFRVTTTSGAVTITLPQISTITDGFKVSIVKWTGDANAVTIARTGSDTINGATSATIGAQYSQTTFVADYETNQWFAASSGLGTSNVAVDVFSGNNSTVAFTLSGDPGSKNNTLVEVSGVYQQKSTYTVSGTTLTFSTAPPTGTSNIEVVWTAPLAIGTPSDGTVTTAKLASTTGSGAVVLATSPTITTPTISSLSSAASTALTLQSAGTTAVTIDTSQNVGIGTTSPTVKLHVASSVSGYTSSLADSVTNAATLLKNNSGDSTVTSFGGTSTGVGTIQRSNGGGTSAYDIAINPFGGNLLVGTTSAKSYGQIQVYKASSTGYAQFSASDPNYNSGASQWVFGMNTIGAFAVYINPVVGGNYGVYLTAGGTSWTANSDERLKDITGNIENALDSVNSLRAVKYTLKADEQEHKTKRVGLIAQDVEKVLPEVVDTNENGYLGVRYSEIVPLLVKAIQELKAINDTQAETINALTARIVALEGN